MAKIAKIAAGRWNQRFFHWSIGQNENRVSRRYNQGSNGMKSERESSIVGQVSKTRPDLPAAFRVHVAGGQGFEPRFYGPEPHVLPLDDPPVSRKRAARWAALPKVTPVMRLSQPRHPIVTEGGAIAWTFSWRAWLCFSFLVRPWPSVSTWPRASALAAPSSRPWLRSWRRL